MGWRQVILLYAIAGLLAVDYLHGGGDDDVILVGRALRLYEDLIFQALPRPEVPADTPDGPVGAREPLTSPGRPV